MPPQLHYSPLTRMSWSHMRLSTGRLSLNFSIRGSVAPVKRPPQSFLGSAAALAWARGWGGDHAYGGGRERGALGLRRGEVEPQLLGIRGRARPELLACLLLGLIPGQPQGATGSMQQACTPAMSAAYSCEHLEHSTCAASVPAGGMQQHCICVAGHADGHCSGCCSCCSPAAVSASWHVDHFAGE